MARRKKGNPVHGWINFYKPVGMSSHAAVGFVRRVFNAQKAGHGGTLDPLAEGVLPIALGEATKVLGVMLDGDKTYRFTMMFGSQTETDDMEGAVIATSDLRPTRQQFAEALPAFTGKILQMPPVYSALKVNGKRACDRVRAGEEVSLKAREVTIRHIEINHFSENEATLTVRVSKGTYVRSLARDLGEKLGCLAHVTRLIRTEHGFFQENDTLCQEKLASCLKKGQDARTLLLDVDAPLDDTPAIAVTPAEVTRLLSGLAIRLDGLNEAVKGFQIKTGAPVRVKNEAGKLVSLATICDGEIKPKRNFPELIKGIENER